MTVFSIDKVFDTFFKDNPLSLFNFYLGSLFFSFIIINHYYHNLSSKSLSGPAPKSV